MLKGFNPKEKEYLDGFLYVNLLYKGSFKRALEHRGIDNVVQSFRPYKIIMKCIDFSVQFNSIIKLVEWLIYPKKVKEALKEVS